MQAAEWNLGVTHLIIDRDTKFTTSFDAVFEAEGARIVRVGPRAPNRNAFAERWVRTLRAESLNHFVICGETHLRHLVTEFVAHYNLERPHQGVGNRPLPEAGRAADESPILKFPSGGEVPLAPRRTAEALLPRLGLTPPRPNRDAPTLPRRAGRTRTPIGPIQRAVKCCRAHVSRFSENGENPRPRSKPSATAVSRGQGFCTLRCVRRLIVRRYNRVRWPIAIRFVESAMRKRSDETASSTGASPAISPRFSRRAVLLGAIAAGGFGAAYAVTKYAARGPSCMKWVPGGEFVMGSTDPKLPQTERPAHPIKVDGFWMDETEVTNAAFRAFVAATGYVTTAERAPDWEEMKKFVRPGTPKPPDGQLVAGSMVFSPPAEPVPTDDASRWWTYVPGACWNHPEGADSNLEGRDDHPVVHVSWDDATAYCGWVGKRLPTEAEWEFAARGELAGKRYTWGDEPPTPESKLANIWQGPFPQSNTKLDGWERTAPVRSYLPNGYGLYDMAGNVWEWCADWYRADAYVRAGSSRSDNPTGPTESWDPSEPWAPKRVTRGGSYLCHVSYCESYRPAARRGTAPDTGMSHIGFRCVMTKAAWDGRKRNG